MWFTSKYTKKPPKNQQKTTKKEVWKNNKKGSVFSAWADIVFYSIFWDIRKYVRRKNFLLSYLTIAYGQKIKHLGSKNVGFLSFFVKIQVQQFTVS